MIVIIGTSFNVATLLTAGSVGFVTMETQAGQVESPLSRLQIVSFSAPSEHPIHPSITTTRLSSLDTEEPNGEAISTSEESSDNSQQSVDQLVCPAAASTEPVTLSSSTEISIIGKRSRDAPEEEPISEGENTIVVLPSVLIKPDLRIRKNCQKYM